MTENEVVQRIWFEITNMQRWDIEWESIVKNPQGEYLNRDEVIEIIERHLAQRQLEVTSR